MKQSGISAWSWRTFEVAVLLLASSCGDENIAIFSPPADEGPLPPAEAGVEPAAEPVTEGAAATGIGDDRGSLELSLQQDPLARGVQRMLETRCGDCHRSERSDGGLADISDLASQIARGNIVPGAAAQSPLLLRILDGSMPPARYARPTPGDLALVTQFIDQLPSTPEPACAALPFQDLDSVYGALLVDLLRAPASDRPFLRYVGLTYASNAGWCGAALERQRSALFKLVNSVSTAPDIRQPSSVDPDGTLYRIDLRDYGWNRAIDRDDDGSTDFADGWLAITASAAPYAVELRGVEADELKRGTGTPVPFLPAHALLHAAAAGYTYNALIGIPLLRNQDPTELGVNFWDYDPASPVRLAGLDGGRRDILVQRAELTGQAPRAYWTIMTDNFVGSESIFTDPESLQGVCEALLHLPNGMLAYQLAGGPRLDALPSYDDCRHSPSLHEADCSACHQSGLLPITDMVRPFVESNPTLFDNDTFSFVQQAYALPAELDAIIQADNQLHAAASERAGVTVGGPDPVSYVYRQFEQAPLSLARVAAELGVTEAELHTRLPGLAAGLQALQDPAGTVSRAVLDDAYAASWCILHAADRNRPVSCP